MKNSMKLFAIAFVSFILSACMHAPKQPVGIVKAINAKPRQAAKPYTLNFNLETDFDEDLKLKPEAQGTRVDVSLDDLDRNWVMDAATKEELIRYALQWKVRYKLLEQRMQRCESGK